MKTTLDESEADELEATQMMIMGLIFEECTEVLSRAQRGRSDSLVVPFFLHAE